MPYAQVGEQAWQRRHPIVIVLIDDDDFKRRRSPLIVQAPETGSERALIPERGDNECQQKLRVVRQLFPWPSGLPGAVLEAEEALLPPIVDRNARHCAAPPPRKVASTKLIERKDVPESASGVKVDLMAGHIRTTCNSHARGKTYLIGREHVRLGVDSQETASRDAFRTMMAKVVCRRPGGRFDSRRLSCSVGAFVSLHRAFWTAYTSSLP